MSKKQADKKEKKVKKKKMGNKLNCCILVVTLLTLILTILMIVMFRNGLNAIMAELHPSGNHTEPFKIPFFAHAEKLFHKTKKFFKSSDEPVQQQQNQNQTQEHPKYQNVFAKPPKNKQQVVNVKQKRGLGKRETPPNNHTNHGGHGFCYKYPECDSTSDKWGGSCKSGLFQSPIDLKSSGTKSPPYAQLSFSPSYFTWYDSFFIKNNGHTIQIQLTEDQTSKCHLSGYGIEDHYILSQLHMHWGPNDNVGSEHLINSQAYPMELHFLHFSSKYKSLGEAAKAHWDYKALAVVAVFLQVDRNHGEKHPGLETIVANMSPVYQTTLQYVEKEINLSQFLPVSPGQVYYRYRGSLTTPSCAEIVLWTVLRDPIYVTEEQVEAFRKIYDIAGDLMDQNYRPPQTLQSIIVEELAVMP